MTLPTVTLSRVRGCLLGGALGDALGYPVEFVASAAQIEARHGSEPPPKLKYADGKLARISDDTQMTLFVAEGVIRAAQRYAERGVAHVPSVIAHALGRWLATQEKRAQLPGDEQPGWLFLDKRLHARRAPGNTNLAALRAIARGREMPSIDDRPNDSKGCGAVMRSAPIGLAASDRHLAFEVARDSAVVTHGHPSGYLSAAYFAAVVHDVARDVPLTEAMANADGLLVHEPGHEELAAAIERSKAISARARSAGGALTSADLEGIGMGWVGEEALAMALACASTATGPHDFARVLWRSVVHAGDSDSTGSLTGNLLGAMYGERALPNGWLEALELRDVIERIARDLHAVTEGTELDWVEYPPG